MRFDPLNKMSAPDAELAATARALWATPPKGDAG
jgi:hypothetical protein